MTHLDDDKRGRLIVEAARYGLRWSVVIGTFFLIFSVIFFPDMISSALWWYPFSFVGMFLWKRHWLLKQAKEILNRA